MLGRIISKDAESDAHPEFVVICVDAGDAVRWHMRRTIIDKQSKRQTWSHSDYCNCSRELLAAQPAVTDIAEVPDVVLYEVRRSRSTVVHYYTDTGFSETIKNMVERPHRSWLEPLGSHRRQS